MKLDPSRRLANLTVWRHSTNARRRWHSFPPRTMLGYDCCNVRTLHHTGAAMILILGGADDHHAVVMLEHLRRLGHPVELLDSRWFPRDLQIAYDPIHETGSIHLPGGQSL